MSKPIYVIKATGEREEFNPQKLRDSLIRARAKPEVADKIVSQIENKLKNDVSTKEIYHNAFKSLGEEGSPAAARYSLRRAVMELGPTGFPFEQFVAEIFRTKGFETQTDFVAKGECADHEVDIVAWNNEKLIMVEAKFHNELGIKSDLKIALYVKARWDDLMGATFNFGKERKLDEGCLVTNTKFSESAVKYAKCRNMKLVGWNYPERGNLQDLIEEAHLHPITCLNSSTPSDEKLLMEVGIVLCKQAKDNPDILKQAGLSDEKIARMLAEIDLIQK
ncbi:MAG: ATP cone domain-containing protein [Candidatus Zambryskibacteria bacterium]